MKPGKKKEERKKSANLGQIKYEDKNDDDDKKYIWQVSEFLFTKKFYFVSSAVL